MRVNLALLVVLVLGAVSLVWLYRNREEAEPPPAPSEAPDFPDWRAPEESELARMIASPPLSELPSLDLEAPEPDLAEAIDATVEDWNPASPDRWNQMRKSDLDRWGKKALYRMEQIVHEKLKSNESRKALIAKIGALDNMYAAGALERILHDFELEPELRALAAYEISRLSGDWINEVLLWKLRNDFQQGHYIAVPYYEPDEYVSIWVAEGLAARGVFTGLDYLLDVEARTSQGLGLYSKYAHDAVNEWSRYLLRRIVTRESEKDAPEAAEDAPIELVLQRAREFVKHWNETGRAPRTAPDLTVQFESRLALRLAKRMLEFNGTDLRQVDEARYILQALGAASLPMLELGLEDPSLFVREYTLDVVERLDACASPIAPKLIALLGDPLTRARALEALGAIGEESRFREWQGLIFSEDAVVKQSTAMALARIASPESRAVLLEAYARLEPTDGGEYRAALATALAGVGRLEGLALWSSLAPGIAELDSIVIDPLLARTREALVGRGAKPASGESWPEEPAKLLEAIARASQLRGRAGEI